MIKLKVCFLLDKSNDWIKSYLVPYIDKLDKNNSYQITYDIKKTYKKDIVFVLGYTKKISVNLIKKYNNFYTIHESNLPKGRGMSPMQWQILGGKKKIKVCLIKINEQIDSGDIYLDEKILLDGTEIYEEIRNKQFLTTLSLITNFIKNFRMIKPNRQKGIATYFKRRKLSDSKLNLNKTLKEQFNLLRINSNQEYPSFFIYKKKKYILKIYKDDN